MTTLTVQERVQLGVRLLDEERPGWEREIELETFNLRTCFDCVLGQLYDQYQIGLEALPSAWLDPVAHGFNYGGMDDLPGVFIKSALQVEWERVIKERITA